MQPCWLGLLRPGLPPWTHTLSRRPATSVRVAPRGVLACDRPSVPKQSARLEHYRQTRHDRPDARLARSGASPEVLSHVAFELASRCHPKAASFRTCAVDAINAVQLEMADARGGSFDDISSHEMTRPPSSAILPCRHDRRIRFARSRKIQPYQAPPLQSCRRNRVMHHRAALAWCSATPIRHTRPCREMDPPSFLFFARRRTWDFHTLRRFVPAYG